MNWIAMINTVACIVLLYFLLVAATFANKMSHKLAIAPLAVVVALQTADPVVAWIPEMTWPAVAMNVAWIIAILLLGRQLMKMVRAL